MSFFEELKSRGATDEEIREVFLEDNNDAIAGLYDKGATVDEIFDLVQEDGGIPKQMFFEGTEAEVKYLKEEEEANKTTSEKVGDAAQAWFEGKELTARGAINPVLKVLSAGERWLSSLGVGDEKDDILEMLTSNKEAIAQLEERQRNKIKELSVLGVKYEPTDISNADIAEFAVEWLPAAALKTIRAAAMGEGLFQGVLSYGEGNTGLEAREDAMKVAGGIYLGGKAIEKTAMTLYPIFSKITKLGKNMISDDLTNLKNMTGIKDDELRKLINETDEDMLPLVLAEAGGDRTRPLLIQALNDSDNATIGKYIDRMTNRAKAAYKSLGGDTSKQTQEIAEQAYSDMVKNIKELDVKINFGDGFRGKLEDLRRVSFDDATDKKIEGFLNQLDIEPITDLSTLLKARKEINEFARQARNSDQAFKLRELSRDMKSFIDESPAIDDGVKQYIGKTNEIYAESMNQKTLLEIFANNSGKSGTGLSRERAVDWASLKDDLIKESEAGNLNMNASETQAIINIAKQFDKKIGNLDDVLFGGVKTSAGKDQPTGIATTLKGRFDQLVTKNMFNVLLERIPGLDSTQLKDMQKLISQSISKSNSSMELAKNIIKSEKTPDSLRKSIEDSLSKIRSDFKPRTKAEEEAVKQLPMTRDLESAIVMPDKNVARPDTREEIIRGTLETKRKKKPTLEGEIVEDTAPMLENKRTKGADIIEAETINRSTSNKLTPEQAKRNNEIVNQINKNLRTIDARKKGLKFLKKESQIKKYEEEIRRLEAENVTLNKKKPKA